MTRGAADRIAAAMANPQWQPTRTQVANIVALTLENDDTDMAWRAGWLRGYWDRVAEENAAYPPERMRVVTSAAQDAIIVHRARMLVDSPAARENDYTGGPVPVWEDEGTADG